jgi:peptidoglycan/LPS O-acetylase OafA/YrhL
MWPITIIIPLLSLAFSSQIKFNKPISGLFKWLGDISYPIYLFHLPIFSLIYVLNPNQKWFLYIFIMFVVTTFVDRYIDRPLKRALKNAYQKYRSRI